MTSEIKKQLLDTETLLYKMDNNTALEYATWTRNKAEIKFQKNFPSFPITSNYIYWCNLGINIGSEQNKIRPVLIVKTKINSPICTVLPLTSEHSNDTRWYHIDLEKQSSTVLIEQLKNISKLRIISPQRIKGKLNRITANDWIKINSALQKYYQLTPLP